MTTNLSKNDRADVEPLGEDGNPCCIFWGKRFMQKLSNEFAPIHILHVIYLVKNWKNSVARLRRRGRRKNGHHQIHQKHPLEIHVVRLHFRNQVSHSTHLRHLIHSWEHLREQPLLDFSANLIWHIHATARDTKRVEDRFLVKRNAATPRDDKAFG